ANIEPTLPDGEIVVGPWRLLLPRVYGFCGGVRHALHALEDALHRHPERQVWLLGDIIHNDTVNERFRRLGVRILENDHIDTGWTRASPEDLLVIPAFGLPLEVEQRVRESGLRPEQIVDTTCAYVKRVWTFVQDAAAQQRTILFHGTPGHPETRATLSRALTPQNAAILIPDPVAAEKVAAAIRLGSLADLTGCDVRNRDRVDLRRLAIANQTTMLCAETRAIENLVAAAVKAVGGDLRRAETLCRATQQRQDAALALCRRGCDLVLVLGGFASSNTTQLYRLAARHCPAYFIRNADAFTRHTIEHFRPETGKVENTSDWLPTLPGRIGLLAGASCPPDDVRAAVRKLQDILG
ncbi:MAG: 4-hydroxy-3-methylbut-2-enyl diphosphate reductase, partial [Lentisphaerae bacterium RIFOXYA12_64_32]